MAKGLNNELPPVTLKICRLLRIVLFFRTCEQTTYAFLLILSVIQNMLSLYIWCIVWIHIFLNAFVQWELLVFTLCFLVVVVAYIYIHIYKKRKESAGYKHKNYTSLRISPILTPVKKCFHMSDVLGWSLEILISDSVLSVWLSYGRLNDCITCRELREVFLLLCLSLLVGSMTSLFSLQ